MSRKDIAAAIKSCNDRIRELESKPEWYSGKRQRKRAIQLELSLIHIYRGDAAHPQDECALFGVGPDVGEFIDHAEEERADQVKYHRLFGHRLETAVLALGAVEIAPLADDSDVAHPLHEEQARCV